VVDLYKSIVKSSDTYYYMLANDLGIDAIARFVSRFGFGSRTGIDLSGEALGVLPSPEWKMRRFKQKWYPGETISIGIGQGYNSYTPLQLAVAIAAIANDGVVPRPHVVDYIEDSRTRERLPVAPAPARTLGLKAEHLAAVKAALVGVTREGTGRIAFQGAEYMSAGKTGTAQVIGIKQGEKYVEREVAERFRDHSLYVAYAPADRPTIALAVIVENAGFGSRAAAPIARIVLDFYLLGKLPAPPKPAKVRANASRR
jgi:penicillin-binding protein 2